MSNNHNFFSLSAKERPDYVRRNLVRVVESVKNQDSAGFSELREFKKCCDEDNSIVPVRELLSLLPGDSWSRNIVCVFLRMPNVSIERLDVSDLTKMFIPGGIMHNKESSATLVNLSLCLLICRLIIELRKPLLMDSHLFSYFLILGSVGYYDDSEIGRMVRKIGNMYLDSTLTMSERMTDLLLILSRSNQVVSRKIFRRDLLKSETDFTNLLDLVAFCDTQSVIDWTKTLGDLLFVHQKQYPSGLVTIGCSLGPLLRRVSGNVYLSDFVVALCKSSIIKVQGPNKRKRDIIKRSLKQFFLSLVELDKNDNQVQVRKLFTAAIVFVLQNRVTIKPGSDAEAIICLTDRFLLCREGEAISEFHKAISRFQPVSCRSSSIIAYLTDASRMDENALLMAISIANCLKIESPNLWLPLAERSLRIEGEPVVDRFFKRGGIDVLGCYKSLPERTLSFSYSPHVAYRLLRNYVVVGDESDELLGVIGESFSCLEKNSQRIDSEVAMKLVGKKEVDRAIVYAVLRGVVSPKVVSRAKGLVEADFKQLFELEAAKESAIIECLAVLASAPGNDWAKDELLLRFVPGNGVSIALLLLNCSVPKTVVLNDAGGALLSLTGNDYPTGWNPAQENDYEGLIFEGALAPLGDRLGPINQGFSLVDQRAFIARQVGMLLNGRSPAEFPPKLIQDFEPNTTALVCLLCSMSPDALKQFSPYLKNLAPYAIACGDPTVFLRVCAAVLCDLLSGGLVSTLFDRFCRFLPYQKAPQAIADLVAKYFLMSIWDGASTLDYAYVYTLSLLPRQIPKPLDVVVTACRELMAQLNEHNEWEKQEIDYLCCIRHFLAFIRKEPLFVHALSPLLQSQFFINSEEVSNHLIELLEIVIDLEISDNTTIENIEDAFRSIVHHIEDARATNTKVFKSILQKSLAKSKLCVLKNVLPRLHTGADLDDEEQLKLIQLLLRYINVDDGDFSMSKYGSLLFDSVNNNDNGAFVIDTQLIQWLKKFGSRAVIDFLIRCFEQMQTDYKPLQSMSVAEIKQFLVSDKVNNENATAVISLFETSGKIFDPEIVAECLDVFVPALRMSTHASSFNVGVVLNKIAATILKRYSLANESSHSSFALYVASFSTALNQGLSDLISGWRKPDPNKLMTIFIESYRVCFKNCMKPSSNMSVLKVEPLLISYASFASKSVEDFDLFLVLTNFVERLHSERRYKLLPISLDALKVSPCERSVFVCFKILESFWKSNNRAIVYQSLEAIELLIHFVGDNQIMTLVELDTVEQTKENRFIVARILCKCLALPRMFTKSVKPLLTKSIYKRLCTLTEEEPAIELFRVILPAIRRSEKKQSAKFLTLISVNHGLFDSTDVQAVTDYISVVLRSGMADGHILDVAESLLVTDFFSSDVEAQKNVEEMVRYCRQGVPLAKQ